MGQQQGGNSSLQDLVCQFKRHKQGMLVIFGITVLLVTLWTFIQSPVYEVTSRVMVKYGREYIYRPVDLLQKGDVQPILSFNRDEIINTELQIFQSSELIASVLQKIGIDKIYPKIAQKERDHEKALSLAVERFKKELDVSHIKGSGVIKVTFDHHDPDIAVNAVSTLEDLFKERHLQIFKSPRMSFLENQLSIYKDKLLNAKKRFEDFKQKNHIISLEEEKKLLLQEYSQVHTLLVQGKGRLHELEEKIASLKAQLQKLPVNVMLFNEKANNIETAKAQLLALELQERDLLQRYREDSRLVKNVREKIHTVRDFLNAQAATKTENLRSGKNYVYQQIERLLIEAKADRKGQIAQNNSLEEQLSNIEAELRDFSKKEATLQMLKQAVEINEKSYKNFVSRLEETRILEAMDNQKLVSVAVIEKPMKPVKPAKPKKALNILVGIILGAALSFFYALFHDYFFPKNRGFQKGTADVTPE